MSFGWVGGIGGKPSNISVSSDDIGNGLSAQPTEGDDNVVSHSIGSYTLGPNEYFLLSAVVSANQAQNGGVHLIAYQNGFGPSSIFSGTYVSTFQSGNIELASDGNGVMQTTLPSGTLSQSDLPVKFELEIHPSETLLHSTPKGATRATLTPDPLDQGGMDTIDAVRFAFWDRTGGHQ